MQLKNFRAACAAGNVAVKRYGDSFNIEKRQFDPDTGSEMSPQIATVSREEIVRQRDEAQKTVDEANALLAECDKLIARA